MDPTLDERRKIAAEGGDHRFVEPVDTVGRLAARDQHPALSGQAERFEIQIAGAASGIGGVARPGEGVVEAPVSPRPVGIGQRDVVAFDLVRYLQRVPMGTLKPAAGHGGVIEVEVCVEQPPGGFGGLAHVVGVAMPPIGLLPGHDRLPWPPEPELGVCPSLKLGRRHRVELGGRGRRIRLADLHRCPLAQPAPAMASQHAERAVAHLHDTAHPVRQGCLRAPGLALAVGAFLSTACRACLERRRGSVSQPRWLVRLRCAARAGPDRVPRPARLAGTVAGAGAR